MSSAPTRRSQIVYASARLQFGNEVYCLLRWHPKWGDWSLLGGHVEAHERDDWLAAVRREIDEELAPLRVGVDVEVGEVAVPETWMESFRKESQSANGGPTQYDVRWFALRFISDPVECLRRVDSVKLVPETDALVRAIVDPQQAYLAFDATRFLRDWTPLAWPTSLPPDALHQLDTLRETSPVVGSGIPVPLWRKLRVGCRTAEDFERAAEGVSSWQSWPSGHPALTWVTAARAMAHGDFSKDPSLPSDPDEMMEAFVNRYAMPAMRLCRLERSRRELGRLGGAVHDEVRAMREPGEFFHGEHLLHLATGLAELFEVAVRVVDRDRAARPDFEIEAWRVAVEVKAREQGDARSTTASHFNNAAKKMREYLRGRDAWHGVLALDLGFVGSPTLSSIGKVGPRLSDLLPDLDDNFISGEPLDAVIVTMQTTEYRRRDDGSGSLVPVEATLLRYSPHTAWRSSELEQCFYVAPGNRIAYRART